jgi:hypothetical protein
MEKYWTAHKRNLKTASNIEHLVDISNAVLSEMRRSNSDDIVTVCGPVSNGGFGNLVENIVWLQRAEEIAMSHGLFVFEQTRLHGAFSRIAGVKDCNNETIEFPIGDIEELCHGILGHGFIKKGLFLPGWEDASGTWAQGRIFFNMRIPIEEFPFRFF